jgi:hypothetical protein
LATSRTIAALKTTGKLERCDEGLLSLARCSADVLDDAINYGEKLYSVAAAGRWHLAVLQTLLGRVPAEPEDDLAALLASMSTMTGDAPEDDWLPYRPREPPR